MTSARTSATSSAADAPTAGPTAAAGSGSDTPAASGGTPLAHTGAALAERLGFVGLLLLAVGVGLLLATHRDHIQRVVEFVAPSRRPRPYPVSGYR